MDNPLKPSCCGGKKCVVMAVIVGIVLLSLAAWLGLKARNAAREYKFIGVPIERNTITMMGEGRVTTQPDIANIQLGTVIEKSTVSAAQKENTRIMNALNDLLAAADVKKADVQTANYSISPQYDWNNGKQTLRGYQVSQDLRVKIRNLDKIGDIIGGAGQLGVNQVGGIEFTVDEPEAIKQQARVKALENAKEKAKALSDVVGLKLRRVISFNENISEPYYNAPYAAKSLDMGMGGAAPAPTIQPGSSEYVIDVNVTYEVE
ncbi:MAG: SIMPL domain-containing protein [Patescibacteria group bacterium]|nr:SIMPL domain-containing protein [Patescibacteria group bacterium]